MGPRPRPLSRADHGRDAAARRPRTARCRSSAPTTTASSSWPTARRASMPLKSIVVDGDRRRTHLISAECHRIRAVARRAVRRLDRALPGLSSCRSSRIAAARSTSRPTARRCRSRGSAPTPATSCTGRATAARLHWTPGARPVRAQKLGTSGAFAGGKTGAGAGRRPPRLPRRRSHGRAARSPSPARASSP